MTITSALLVGAITRFRRPWQPPYCLSSLLSRPLRSHEPCYCNGSRKNTLHQHCRGSSDKWVLNTRTRGLTTKDNADNHVNPNDRYTDFRTSKLIVSVLPYTTTTTHALSATPTMCSTRHPLTPLTAYYGNIYTRHACLTPQNNLRNFRYPC